MILVATDFSNAAARAVELAARLVELRLSPGSPGATGASDIRAAPNVAANAANAAGSPESDICLLHVFEPPSGSLPHFLFEPRLEQDLRKLAVDQLAFAASALRSRGMSVAERLETGGSPSRVIADVASELKPELVVLGRHGSRAVPRLLLGSVAESALMRISQPVLIVPDQPGPGVNTPTDRRWRIAVGVDRSSRGSAVIDWVRELRKTIPCDLTFIHLYWPISEYARLGLLGPRDLFEPDPTTVGLLERSLTRVIGEMPGTGDTTVQVRPGWGPIGEQLVDEAGRAGADLLVLGTHHRHGLSRLWHGATAPPAIHAATLPVLCVSQTARSESPEPIPRPRSVLVATDLSELGNRAIPHAYSLVRAERGTVHLLHVHEHALPSPAYAYAPLPEGALTPAEKSELHVRLLAQVPPQAADLGIASEVIVVDGGRAGEVICQTAERLDTDVIVLGSHGRSGISRAVLGSVAGHVLHQAHRPVFVVRLPAE